MFGFGEAKDARNSVYDGDVEEHKSKFSHEFIGGAAAFEAMKLYEDRQRKEGKAVSHGLAKEILAGIAGAEVDKLFETKGLDFIDRERAKHHAKKQAEELYNSHYGNMDQYDPSSRGRHEATDY